MDIISATGILLAIVIAFWQFKKAKAAENELNSILKNIPSEILDNLGIVIDASVSNVTVLQPNEQPIKHTFISYADVNYDSENELLVQYPTGPHNIHLRIFGYKDYEFTELAFMMSGTPEGFEFGDYDGDGKVEIAARQTDWSSGESYASAPRMTIIYKWTGQEFSQIAEIKDRLNVSINNINKPSGA